MRPLPVHNQIVKDAERFYVVKPRARFLGDRGLHLGEEVWIVGSLAVFSNLSEIFHRAPVPLFCFLQSVSPEIFYFQLGVFLRHE